MREDNRPRGPRGCVGKNGTCGMQAISGATVCRMHGGMNPEVMRRAMVRTEVAKWTLGAPTVDPGETLLRLVSQSAARVERYSALLAQAYETAERVAEAGNLSVAEVLAAQDMREVDAEGNIVDEATPGPEGDIVRKFHDVLVKGGVSVLINKTYSAAGKDGHVFATGEAIRGLVALETAERKLCADFCMKAVAAGLAEREVRMAERLGGQIALVVAGTLTALGVVVTDAMVQAEVVRQLELVA